MRISKRFPLRNVARAAAATLALFAAQPPLAAGAQGDASPEASYLRALAATSSLPQPPFVTFRARLQTTNVTFDVRRYPSGFAVFSNTFANGAPAQTLTFDGRHRLADDRSILASDGHAFVASSSLFNPTWQGVEEWLRYGLFNEAERAVAPVALPAAAPSATPQPVARPSGLAVIASVRAMRSKDYVVTRAAPERCASDGSAGDHLHLVARGDANDDPLTDVVIDPSGLICTLRFTLAGRSAYSVRGAFELDFARSGAYWVVQRGSVAYAVRSLGIGKVDASLAFDYADLAFPANLPDAAFAP